MTLVEKLSLIQQNMKAPKNLYNKFGNYKYRNAEGILEAFKPYEDEYKVALKIEDDIVSIGARYYVKAIVTLYDAESEERLSVSALAREEESKKGMDGSQITGTASSYSRKYALNGLFLLDDTKDADTDENKIEADSRAKADEKEKAKPTAAKQTKEPEEQPVDDSLDLVHFNTLKHELERTGVNETSFLKSMGVSDWDDFNMALFKKAMNKFKKTPDKKA